MVQKIIKSKKRVAELGEVFTPAKEVKSMVDLIPNLTANMTFLEPSCGTGNFLVEILQRKIDLFKGDKNSSDWAIHILDCYGSIYGVDIMEDNVIECRKRLLEMNPIPQLEKVLEITLNENIIVGDWLEMQGVDYKKQKKQKKV